MTWTKVGVEFFDELADLGLSDAAVRTHAEGIGYVYRTENTDLSFPESSLRRFAGTEDPVKAAAELTAAGCWRRKDGRYVIVHHADVVRQSLATQRDRREQQKVRQRRHRARKQGSVTGDVTRDVRTTQTDRQTFSQQRREPPTDVSDWDEVRRCAGCSGPVPVDLDGWYHPGCEPEADQ